MTMLKFTKMHGLGNDFIVIDALNQKIDFERLPVADLADRHRGIGFDQMLVITASERADFYCRIFNADGNEAEQCGNGLRCVARYIHENGLLTATSLTLETRAGIYPVTIFKDYTVQVGMGAPVFTPAQIPFKTDSLKNIYQLAIDGKQPLEMSVLSMGNPHAIMQVTSLHNYPVQDLGAALSKHAAFPNQTNVGFMEVINRQHIKLRTFERGTGETFACGSNACAAVVAGINNQLLDKKVKVSLTLGDLWVEWEDKTGPVQMTGPATHIFNGIITLHGSDNQPSDDEYF
jgi:diaminopimelate epimerase